MGVCAAGVTLTCFMDSVTVRYQTGSVFLWTVQDIFDILAQNQSSFLMYAYGSFLFLFLRSSFIVTRFQYDCFDVDGFYGVPT